MGKKSKGKLLSEEEKAQMVMHVYTVHIVRKNVTRVFGRCTDSPPSHPSKKSLLGSVPPRLVLRRLYVHFAPTMDRTGTIGDFFI